MNAAAFLEFRCKDSPAGASHKAVNDGGSGGSGQTLATASNDAALAARFAAGEAGALEQLVAAYQPRVERLAHRLLGWRGSGDVEDAVQDAFLSALSNAKRVRGERGLWPWLATITVNACRTRRRRAWVRETFLRRRQNEPAERESRDASSATEDREALQRVRAAIDRLPTRDREVIVLHCLEEMRLNDVADVLAISPNAVQVRLHRARQRLRIELDQPTKD